MNMKFRNHLITRAAIFALLIGLSMATVVSAITIIIDGVQEVVWIDGAGGQTPGAIADPQEGSIPDALNVQTIRYTNDQTYFYFLLETYANTDWGNFARKPYWDICLNTDSNTGTGFSYENCDGTEGQDMQGIDRLIRVSASNNSSPYTVQFFVLDQNGDPIYNSVAGDAATQGRITEIRVPLTQLGLNSSTTCNSNMLLGSYFDGQTVADDDNIPDTGQVTITCGGPTAVTLSSTNAQGQTAYIITLALVGMFGLGLLSFATVQKRRM